MAKRTSRTQIIRAVPVRAPTPIIRVAAPRAPSKPKKSHRRRRSSGGAGMTGTRLMGVALGGAVFGFLLKTFPQIPSLPVVGRSGTVALASYACRNMGSGMVKTIIQDTGLAAAAIAGFSFGQTGTVTGDIPPQVHGIASQV